MTKKDIRLIISDIDGTILDNQHRVDPKLKAQIPRLQERGIPFVLASARSPLGMAPIARELGLGNYPLACYNGALIITGNPQNYQTLVQHPLDKGEITPLLELMREQYPTVSINLYSGKDWFSDRLDQWVQTEAQITGEKPMIQDLSLALLDDLRPIHKMLFIDEPATIQHLYGYLQGLDLPNTAFYLSKAHYLEVTAKPVSKEKALQEIARYYELPLSQVMTIGDNFNDLPMLQLAGLGVAMANAPEQVRAQADIITSSNNEHGVAQIIGDWILR